MRIPKKVLNLKMKRKHTRGRPRPRGESRRRSFEKTQTDGAVLLLDDPHKTGNIIASLVFYVMCKKS
jgi:hypothetical protein